MPFFKSKIFFCFHPLRHTLFLGGIRPASLKFCCVANKIGSAPLSSARPNAVGIAFDGIGKNPRLFPIVMLGAFT